MIVKVLAAFISFAIVILNAKHIGAEGVGEISLIILNITILVLFSGIIAGPALVYFTPRKKLSELSIISTIWILIIMILAYFANQLLQNFPETHRAIIPRNQFNNILALSFIQSFYSVNMGIILGKEKIKTHNAITSVQFVVLLLALLIHFYILQNKSVEAYINSYYLAIIIPTFISFSIIVKKIFAEGFSINLRKTSKEMFIYGIFSQPASIIQILNYRIPYYFLSKSLGLNKLGIFTTANQISEGLWIFSKSVAMVQYSKIANTNNKESNIILTLKLLKFTVLITLLPLFILILIPEKAYLFIIGNNEFEGLKQVIYYLSPGIIFMTINTILAHYFSGIGKPKYNMYISALSLIFAIISGIILIPKYGLIGGGITASITYTSGALAAVILFIYKTKTKAKDFALSTHDIQFSINFIKNLIKNK
jgi:O-antigen/teichoic acid export membrane protein